MDVPYISGLLLRGFITRKLNWLNYQSPALAGDFNLRANGQADAFQCFAGNSQIRARFTSAASEFIARRIT